MGFLTCFVEDEENKCLTNIHKLINKNFQKIVEFEEKRNKIEERVREYENVILLSKTEQERMERYEEYHDFIVQKERIDRYREAGETEDETLSCEKAQLLLIKLLRFLQLLCENHNRSLQDHLRSQGTSRNKDFVELLSFLFGQYIKLFNTHDSPTGV